MCDVNWARVARTNTHRIERTADFRALRPFIADVALGDAERGGDVGAMPSDELVKALRVMQYSAQYLLHCQQVLREQKSAMDAGAAEAARRERKAHAHLDARRERLRMLRDGLRRFAAGA